MKLEGQLTYLGGNILSIEIDGNISIVKAGTIIDWLSPIWKSDPSEEIK